MRGDRETQQEMKLQMDLQVASVECDHIPFLDILRHSAPARMERAIKMYDFANNASVICLIMFYHIRKNLHFTTVPILHETNKTHNNKVKGTYLFHH